MTRIKICGITNLEDAKYAVELGVDSLGFIFAASPRQVSSEQVKRITEELPPFINQTGVFVNGEVDQIQEIASYCGLDTLQLHGDESPKYCRQFENKKVIKAFRIKESVNLERLAAYDVSGYLLDTYVAKQPGGTGKTFNWDLALQAKEKVGPVILAGGLNPENVVRAVKQVTPYGIDISSGIEKEPGLKEHSQLKKLVTRVRRINHER